MAALGGLLPSGYETLEDANGTTVPGGLVWTYAAGTTTPLVTYTDNQLTVPNTNPIIADGSGRWTAYAAFGVGFKLVFETPAVPPAHGATIKTCDNIVSPLTELTSVDPGGTTVIKDSSATGAVNNYVLVGRVKETYWEWQGAADLLLTGLSGGVIGQRITIKNVASTVNRKITFAHQNAGSTALNQFFNAIVTGPTPIGPMGWVTYVYNGSGWILTEHNQGSWITRPFAAANFSASTGTWTVATAARDAYFVIGRTMHYSYNVGGTNAGGPTANLLIVVPGGFTTVGGNADVTLNYTSIAGVIEPGLGYGGGTNFTFIRIGAVSTFPNGVNNIAGGICVEIQ
jgi:hypothetical protein